jgi:hypothetical protein
VCVVKNRSLAVPVLLLAASLFPAAAYASEGAGVPSDWMCWLPSHAAATSLRCARDAANTSAIPLAKAAAAAPADSGRRQQALQELRQAFESGAADAKLDRMVREADAILAPGDVMDIPTMVRPDPGSFANGYAAVLVKDTLCDARCVVTLRPAR